MLHREIKGLPGQQPGEVLCRLTGVGRLWDEIRIYSTFRLPS